MNKKVTIKNSNKSKNKLVISDLTNYFFDNLKPKLDNKQKNIVQDQTSQILNNCVLPCYPKQGSESNTGIVIGYVQSGKTLSFTSLIALAADNKYRMVILLAGRTNILLDQTVKRLKKDLGDDDKSKNYKFFVNPNEKDDIEKQLTNKREPTIIITLLKHQNAIQDLIKIFKYNKVKNEINKKGILIIDDESDQASLNSYALKNNSKSKAAKEYSTIYKSITDLKEILPYHSYIQYTATPQGNLLIDLIDILSPKWHVILEPGNNYTGGNYFFKNAVLKNKLKANYSIQLGIEDNKHVILNNNQTNIKSIGYLELIREIPNKEVYHPEKNPLDRIPESLQDCLLSFLINATIAVEITNKVKFVSMMVHVSHLKSSSEKFHSWLGTILKQWEKDYNKNNLSLKKRFEDTFIKEEEILKSGLNFKVIYDNLKYTLSDYKLHLVLSEAQEISWSDSSTHILIGGVKLDRGFTVEKLTHTYMPRYSLGQSQADTIQQRCRFFGYKLDYIKNCRVYLPKDSICEYADYVLDEESLRLFLKNHELKDFYDEKQTLSLSKRLLPTRKNILPVSISKNNLEKSKYFNITDIIKSQNNFNLSRIFLKKIKSNQINTLDYNTDIRKHNLYDVNCNEFINLFLNRWEFSQDKDHILKMKIVRYLKEYYLSERKIENCYIIEMSKGKPRKRTINPISDDNDTGIYKIDLLSGQANEGKDKYPGDSNLLVNDNCKYHHIYKNKKQIVIQIHLIESKCNHNKNYDNKKIAGFSIYFPSEYSKNYIAINK